MQWFAYFGNFNIGTSFIFTHNGCNYVNTWQRANACYNASLPINGYATAQRRGAGITGRIRDRGIRWIGCTCGSRIGIICPWVSRCKSINKRIVVNIGCAKIKSKTIALTNNGCIVLRKPCTWVGLCTGNSGSGYFYSPGFSNTVWGRLNIIDPWNSAASLVSNSITIGCFW